MGMPTLATVEVHAEVTGRSGYRYQFTPKHHGAEANAAQWLPSLTLGQEFAVFNLAGEHDLSDDGGRFFGVQPDGEDGLVYLGTWHEQVAEFPLAREGELWHGYPLYPVSELAPPNRQGEKGRPAREVFDKMVGAGIITRRHRKRLMKGDHV
jgi:hypothetical protein